LDNISTKKIPDISYFASMKNEVFSNISKIIERDSKSTTYKFALLRGVIEIIQENSPYISIANGRAHFPLGLLIEKWILYYYPILESKENIPQINGSSNLAFENNLKDVINYYQLHGGFSAFYNDLKNKGIPKPIENACLTLFKTVKQTITNMPMKYIGRSISDSYYSIFQFTNLRFTNSHKQIDLEFLINSFGSFSIPFAYYEAFQFLGNFIGGQDSILFKWAEFSVNASGASISMETVLHKVLESPITERDVAASKQLYKSILAREGKVPCLWTGKSIHVYDIDHIIPFSVWRNNDLWNLLPASKKVNHEKRDKIPTPHFIEQRKDALITYWEIIHDHQQQRFQREIQVSLLGNHTFDNWQNTAILKLQNTCDYLINTRGFRAWE
jgi:hypothetical protein